MKTFLRLLSYTFRYKWRFITGVIVAFFVAVLNGMSLTAFVPLFEALGDREAYYEIQFTVPERKILRKAVNYLLDKKELKPGALVVPRAPGRIKKDPALEFLNATYKDYDYGLTNLQRLRLRTMIRWKLRINAAGYTPLEIVYLACMIVLPLYLLKLGLLLLSVRLIAKTGYRAVRDIRADLYQNAQQLPLTYFYREKTGLLMSRLINDSEIVAAVISSNMRDAITNFFYIVTHILLLAYLNLPLLLVTLVVVPLMLSPVTLFTRKIRKATDRGQVHLADLNGHLLEAIAGVRVIRAFGMEEYERDRFEQVNQKLFWRMFKQQYYIKVGPYMVEFFSVLVSIGVIALGAFFMDPVTFTGGEFIAFLVIFMFIIRPIIQLSGMYSKIAQCTAAGDRIFEIMDKKRDIHEPETPLKPEPMRDAIEFSDVRFVYPETENEVLKGINLRVPMGKTIALVGESGGGKSTMMDLLARFFDPTQGAILVDGRNIRDFRIADHRKRIGIVTQDIFLFHGTIRDNIAYGQAEYSEQDIEKAARLAHAHDFIAEMPEGYDTVIGERGFTLSGGQRQRIAVARALLRDPEILILDEATSALDTESERLVQSALERLFKNRTTFVIAHRLSTIEKADMICVVSEGEIVEKGTHEELMKGAGVYQRLQEISRQSVPG